MRIGVFGGTFDPVHLGHLILAEQCREQGKLDAVWFVPAARPPHKPEERLTRLEQRVEMLQLAIAGHPQFRVLDIEKDRPGPSYTVDTLAVLREMEPTADFWLLVGSDTLADLPNWHEPIQVLARAGLLVMPRSGFPLIDESSLKARLIAMDLPVRMQVVEAPAIEIASSDLRLRTAEGRSLRYLVPRAIECYIHEKRLYRAHG